MKFVLLMIQNNYDEFYSYQCMHTIKDFDLFFKVDSELQFLFSLYLEKTHHIH